MRSRVSTNGRDISRQRLWSTVYLHVVTSSSSSVQSDGVRVEAERQADLALDTFDLRFPDDLKPEEPDTPAVPRQQRGSGSWGEGHLA